MAEQPERRVPGKPCARCRRAIPRGDRYCSVCRSTAHRAEHQRRGSKQARGYGDAWPRVRLAKLHQDPLCERCDGRGHTAPATMVHHIVPIATDPSRRLDWDNLMSLCEPCHDAMHRAGEPGG